jgi:hypothetical protein
LGFTASVESGFFAEKTSSLVATTLDYGSELMRRCFVTAWVICSVLSIESASAAKVETFDSAASAAAHGWSVVGTGLDGQTAGWIGSSDAGGSPGEAQFDVRRGASVLYADSNLGVTINGIGGFSMSGKLNLVGLVGTPDLGNPPILGFFTSPTQFLGIHLRGDFDDLGSDLAWGVRFATTGDGLRINAGGDATRKIGVGVPRTFLLSYDPSLGPFGTIHAEVSGAGAAIDSALSETNRDLLNGVALNLAGLIKSSTGANTNGINLRVDDLNYTGVAVPEPATPLVAMSLVVGVAIFRSRARSNEQPSDDGYAVKIRASRWRGAAPLRA